MLMIAFLLIKYNIIQFNTTMLEDENEQMNEMEIKIMCYWYRNISIGIKHLQHQ